MSSRDRIGVGGIIALRGEVGPADGAEPTPSRTRIAKLTASQIRFAQQVQVLPFRYSEVVDLASGRKNLLFAMQEGGPEYSELHVAAGERAILRLSQEIAQLSGALVRIDEIEAGLHPWVQQLLMLHLQQLALRRDLLIVVTFHSPVVLDSVPQNARIFLDRDASDICRLIGRLEAERDDSDIQPLVEELEAALQAWRSA